MFEPPIIVAWSLALASFLGLVYLFMTWPSDRDGIASDRRGDSPSSQAAQHLSNLDGTRDELAFPQQLAMDGEFGDFGSVITAPGARRVAEETRGTPPLQVRIIRAGIYHRNSAARFRLVRILLCVGSFAAGALVAPVFSLPLFPQGVLIGAVITVAGLIIPSFWLDRRLRVRQTRVRRALPDALDLITVCLQGGLSFPAALSRISRELGTAHPLLAAELAIVQREIQMGRTTGDSMRQFAGRFNMEELRSLASVIGQAEKFGGSIAKALNNYAESLRTKRRIRAEEMAQKAAVKVLFPTLLCIFPGIFIVVLGPTAIRIYQVLIVGNPWGGA